MNRDDIVVDFEDTNEIEIKLQKSFEKYNEGYGIKITGKTISVDNEVIPSKEEVYDKTTTDEKLAEKQNVINSENKLDADLVSDDNSTHKFFSAEEKSKLSGIEAGAEVNVQADWNEDDSTKDSYIKNKPSIPAEQIQADWNQSDNTQKDFIKNKPSVVTTNTEQEITAKKTFNSANIDFKNSTNVTYTLRRNGNLLEILYNGNLVFSINNQIAKAYNLLPFGDSAELGGSSNKWLNLFLSGVLNDGTNQISVAQMVAKQNSIIAGQDIIKTNDTISVDRTYINSQVASAKDYTNEMIAKVVFNAIPTRTISYLGYQVSVPADVKPYASLNKLGFMSYKSENLILSPTSTLFYLNQVTVTPLIDNTYKLNGTATNNDNKTIYVFNNLEVGKSYTLESFTNENCHLRIIYEHNGSDIYNWSTQTGQYNYKTFTPTANDSNFRLQLLVINNVTYNNTIIKPMLVSGSTAPTEFKQGFTGIRDSAITSVKSYGANLLDLSQGTNGYIDNSGNIVARATQFASDYIEVKKGQPYIVKTSQSFFNIGIAYYDINKTIVLPRQDNNGVSQVTVTPSANGYIRLWFNVDNATNINASIQETYSIMLNIGSTALPYKAYRGLIDTYTIPAEVQALEGYGRGINNNCYNVLDLVNKSFEDKDGRVDLGTFTPTYDGSYYKFNYTGIPNAKTGVNSEASNILMASYNTKSVNYITANLNEDMLIGYSGGNILSVRNLSYTDPTTFKTAMSGVMLQYELATYNNTDVSQYITDSFIEVEAGGYLVAENEYGQSVPFELTYIEED